MRYDMVDQEDINYNSDRRLRQLRAAGAGGTNGGLIDEDWTRAALAAQRENTGGNFQTRLDQAMLDSQRAMVEAGHGAIPGLEAGTTADGMQSGLGSILQNSGAITGARSGAAGDYLARSGLGGRANAMQAAGRMSTSDTFAIEDELNRRRQGLAGIGMTGMGVQSDIMNAQGIRGQTQSLMRAQNKAQQRTQNMNLLGGLLGAAGGMSFGGGGGGGSMASDYTGAAMQNWLRTQ